MKQAIQKIVDLENESTAHSVHYSNLKSMSGSYYGIVFHDSDYYEAEESTERKHVKQRNISKRTVLPTRSCTKNLHLSPR